jgi:hypothetical protein
MAELGINEHVPSVTVPPEFLKITRDCCVTPVEVETLLKKVQGCERATSTRQGHGGHLAGSATQRVPGLQSQQANGPAAIDSALVPDSPFRKTILTILAQPLCASPVVAIKLFISQWVGRLSNRATRSWRNVPNKNCTVCGGCVTTSSIMSASSSWVNNSLISKQFLSNICAITFLAGLAGTWCARYVNRKQFPVEFKYASRGTVKLQGKMSDGGFSWAHRSTDMISKPARCSTVDTLRPQSARSVPLIACNFINPFSQCTAES